MIIAALGGGRRRGIREPKEDLEFTREAGHEEPEKRQEFYK